MINKNIYINGRFLQKPITGTERFAREIVRAMDRLIERENLPFDVQIIAPQNTPPMDGLKKIGFKMAGSLQGHAWEQWDLYRATRKGELLSFTNSGPVLHPNQMVVIHDAAPYRVPQDFSFGYRTFHRILGHSLSFRSKLATVSAFSQGELVDILNVKAKDIPIYYNGHEHILNKDANLGIVDRIGLKGRPFFLFVGSHAKRKNIELAIQGFCELNNPDIVFVIVGAPNAKVFASNLSSSSENIIFTGRLEDAEIIGLYRHANGLLFPSLYEGFGIPPLEAMVYGCPVIASDIPPVREVCGDAALYFNASSVKDCTSALKGFLDHPERRQGMVERGKERCALFSWEASAALLLRDIEGFGKKC